MRIVSNGKTFETKINGFRGSSGPDGSPIGTIISFMGKNAPKDYLVCDGGVYNISDYPHLASFIQKQFQTINYFGGDGTTTFAVPDMRNLFLRGWYADSEEQLSSDIGKRQEATEIPVVIPGVNSSGNMILGSTLESATPGFTTSIINPDVARTTQSEYWEAASGGRPSLYENAGDILSYTTRPVNIAVLYCIKAVESITYENTYSLEEQIIGRWIDGKPLYCKVMSFTTPGKVDGLTYPIRHQADIRPISWRGHIIVSDTVILPLVYVGPDGFGTSFYFDSTASSWSMGVTHINYGNKPGILIAEYTKNTDKAIIDLPEVLTSIPPLYASAPQSAAGTRLDIDN